MIISAITRFGEGTKWKLRTCSVNDFLGKPGHFHTSGTCSERVVDAKVRNSISNEYILLDVLLCSIPEYFYEFAVF